jgi:hypothetical protein
LCVKPLAFLKRIVRENGCSSELTESDLGLEV